MLRAATTRLDPARTEFDVGTSSVPLVGWRNRVFTAEWKRPSPIVQGPASVERRADRETEAEGSPDYQDPWPQRCPEQQRRHHRTRRRNEEHTCR
jgi:hypothetical protein